MVGTENKMIKLECFPSCKSFLSFYEGVCENFPMVMEYLEKDDCYLDDKWIQWFAITEDDELLAFIAFRQESVLPDSVHISVFEVSKDLRNIGHGTRIIKSLTRANKWTLYASDEKQSFYERCGFVKSKEVDNFYLKGF